ncbi:MAG: hypothetical protein ACOY4F_06895 [Thermodesulfobacteriota bacterium]
MKALLLIATLCLSFLAVSCSNDDTKPAATPAAPTEAAKPDTKAAPAAPAAQTPATTPESTEKK